MGVFFVRENFFEKILLYAIGGERFEKKCGRMEAKGSDRYRIITCGVRVGGRSSLQGSGAFGILEKLRFAAISCLCKWLTGTGVQNAKAEVLPTKNDKDNRI